MQRKVHTLQLIWKRNGSKREQGPTRQAVARIVVYEFGSDKPMRFTITCMRNSAYLHTNQNPSRLELANGYATLPLNDELHYNRHTPD